MNDQMNKDMTKIARLLSWKPVGTAILPFAMAMQLLLPQPTHAQECETIPGTIEENNAFTESDSGSDFKITCKGDLPADYDVYTESGLGGQAGYIESQSIVIIDLSEVTGNTTELTINSNAKKTILIGALTSSEEPDDAADRDSVVSVGRVVSPDGLLYDVNVESRATINSEGDSRIGLEAWVDSGDAAAKSVLNLTNSGSITTEGTRAHGVEVGATAGTHKGSRVVVDNSGTISTTGDGASGLSAYLQLDDEATTDAANALGLISVTNSGTISVEGDGTNGQYVTGLEAVYRHSEADPVVEIANSGNVEIESSGIITTSGNRAKGIYARTYGTGKVSIKVSGSVTAGDPGAPAAAGDSTSAVPRKFGIGIHGMANTGTPVDGEDATSLADSTKDVDVMIVVSGSSASIMAYGTSNNKGVGILAETEATTGHAKVEISNEARVSAYGDTDTTNGYAVKFMGGQGTLDIDGANLVGNIMFTGNDDVLNIDRTGSIVGDVKFGGGNDKMNLNIGGNQRFQITGDITGLTDLTKKGTGYARFGGDVTFDGSMLKLEEGALVIAGTMNLGTGEVTIHKAGKLVFEVGIDDGGSVTTGSIEAGTMHFEEVEADDVAVYVQLNDELTEEQVTAARTGLSSKSHTLLSVDSITHGTEDSSTTVDSLSINTVTVNDETVTVGSIIHADGIGTATFTEDTINQIAKLNPGPPPASTGGDDDNNDVLLGLGLVAVLLALYWGDGLFGSSFADDYAFSTPQSAYIASIDEQSRLTVRENTHQPYQVFIRTGTHDTLQMAGVTSAGVSGTEIGLSLYRSDDFYIEAASAQNVVSQVNALNQQAQGEVYSLSSGWQNETYFAGIKLSHGEFDTETVIDNPVVSSQLFSESEVIHTQAQFTTGTRWHTGGLDFTPSASIQAGTFDYSAHQAKGAALSAEIPSYSQDYSALRVGLKMSATDWLSFADDRKWKPHLQLDQIRTDSDNKGGMSLRQMDRLGALSFNSGAAVQALPELVTALSFGASVKSSKSSQGEWRFGYAGLQADGEYYHAAVAAYQMRF